MGRQPTIALFVLALVTVVVSVDLLFFRGHVWERLIANVAIVLAFWALSRQVLKPR